MQRQYVEAFTVLLVVLMLSELQKGQIVGAEVSGGWLYIRRLSPPWIVPLAHTLFGYPLMADASEVNIAIAPTP